MRYTGAMNINTPLTPHLEQFVRDQLASGRFHTEAELIRVALGLLEDHCHSQSHSAVRLKSELNQARAGAPAERTVSESSERGQESENVRRFSDDKAPERRSPRGILADLCSHISPDEIEEARREMWAGLSQGEA